MTEVYLLLGSNLGERELNLMNALTEIDSRIGRINSRSEIYCTAAWGKKDQPDFYNQAIQVYTELSADLVLEQILDIESKLGRIREIEKWSERTMDIDILFYGDQIIRLPRLMVPHPHLAVRRFALAPMAELNPGFIHPESGLSLIELLENCEDMLEVKRIENAGK